MRLAIVFGIVTGDAPVSYWPIFSLSLEGRKEGVMDDERGHESTTDVPSLQYIYINIITVSLDVSIQRRH